MQCWGHSGQTDRLTVDIGPSPQEIDCSSIAIDRRVPINKMSAGGVESRE